MAVVTKFPTANEAGAEGFQWSSPVLAQADDGVGAGFTTILGTEVFDRLWKTFGFDAAIPAGSTIDKVQLIVKWGTDGFGTLDTRAHVSGVYQTAHTSGLNQPFPTTETFDITGDRSWTRADLLDAVFKVNARGFGGVAGENFVLDYVKVEVTYTASSTPTTLRWAVDQQLRIAGWFTPRAFVQGWFDQELYVAGVNVFTYAGSGGAVTGGSATYCKGKAPPSVGGIVTGGVAPYSKGKDYPSSGGAVTGGAAVVTKGKNYPSSGGAVTGGSATLSKTKVYAGVGGAVTGGTAPVSKTKVYTAIGGAVTGGAAPVSKTKVYVAIGGAVTGGGATLAKGKNYLGLGTAVTGGAAVTLFVGGTNVYTYVASGGAVTGGAAAVSKGKEYPFAGGALAGGAATTSYVDVNAPTPGTPGNLVAFANQNFRPPKHPFIRVYVGSGGLRAGGAAVTRLINATVPLRVLEPYKAPKPQVYVYKGTGKLRMKLKPKAITSYVDPWASVRRRDDEEMFDYAV